MSRKPAALPLFGDAYLADTQHLTTEEHGAYLLLMLAAWRQDDCALPLDDKKLARIAKLTLRRWLIIRPTILAFWTIEEGRITQQRLLKEWSYVLQKSESNRENIGKRWSKQATENNESGGYERIYETDTPPPPPPPIKESSVAKATSLHAREPDPFPKPDWADDQVWSDFMRNRKAKRCVNTATAYAGFLGDVARLTTDRWSPARLLEHAAAKGWGGIYQPREETVNGSAQASRPDRRTAVERALDRRLAELDEPAGETGRRIALPGPSDC